MRFIVLFALLALSLFLVACTVETPSETSKIVEKEVQKESQSAAVDIGTERPAGIQEGSIGIECRTDSDCGKREIIGDTNCFQGNVQGTFVSYTCVNPGTSEAYCDSERKTGIIEECPDTQFCKLGECTDYVCTDSDGGINSSIKGRVVINDGSVFDDNCESDDKLLEYYCSEFSRAASSEIICNCSKDSCN